MKTEEEKKAMQEQRESKKAMNRIVELMEGKHRVRNLSIMIAALSLLVAWVLVEYLGYL